MTPLFSPEIEKYASTHSTAPSELLNELEIKTYAECESPQMVVGALEGAFLGMMVAATGAKRVLEIGMFTGYSALAMAEALPDDGELIACDINEETSKIAQSFFDCSPHGKKITIKLGPAIETLGTLDESFDLVFIDADKENYYAYYEAVLPKLRTGGLILADNVLWSGDVLNPKSETDHALVEFNKKVTEDARVENVLLTLRDGVMMARKL